MTQRRVRVGDVFAVPLADGRWGYVHYVRNSSTRGPIIRVLDMVTAEITTIEDLKGAGEMFPPIAAYFYAEVDQGRWVKVGHIPVTEFKFPLFVGGHRFEGSWKVHTWFLCDEHDDHRIGPVLPSEHQDKEYLTIYPAQYVEQRILNPQDRWWLREGDGRFNLW